MLESEPDGVYVHDIVCIEVLFEEDTSTSLLELPPPVEIPKIPVLLYGNIVALPPQELLILNVSIACVPVNV